MQAYAYKCSLGDDVYHDPATRALEESMARMTGKEAAIFMPSGTMSNQVGLRTLLVQPPYSVLCDHRAHVYKYEAGGIGFHSGAAVIPIIPLNSASFQASLEPLLSGLTYAYTYYYYSQTTISPSTM